MVYNIAARFKGDTNVFKSNIVIFIRKLIIIIYILPGSGDRHIKYFKFTDRRNKDSVKLKPYEIIPWKVKKNKEIGKNEAQLARNFDGEIHFNYPERFYQITEIILKVPAQ